MPISAVAVLDGSFAGGVGDVIGELGRDGSGLDDGDSDAGLELDAQRLRPAVDAALGPRSPRSVASPMPDEAPVMAATRLMP